MKCIHTKDQDRRSKENGMGRACSMNETEFCLEKVKEDHSEELRDNTKMGVKEGGRMGTGWSWLKRPGVFCGCGSEHSASMKFL
jgi:hypothetical protein